MKKVLLGLVITIMLTNNCYAKNFKQRTNQELIVIFEVSYSEDFEIIEKYLIDEEVPFIFGVNKDNLTRFEWFFMKISSNPSRNFFFNCWRNPHRSPIRLPHPENHKLREI